MLVILLSLAIGMATRNIGAALAPSFSVPAVEQRAIVVVVLEVPGMVTFGLWRRSGLANDLIARPRRGGGEGNGAAPAGI